MCACVFGSNTIAFDAANTDSMSLFSWNCTTIREEKKQVSKVAASDKLIKSN